MSKLGLVIVMMLLAGRNKAQNYPAPNTDPLNFFVLIQADDQQAFYVRLDSQLYSSTRAGHLILSKLKDSIYTIAIGFPGQTFPEQRFMLDIHQKDWVLRLSHRDNAWGLYDGKGQAVTSAADPAVAQRPLLAGVKKDDAFSQLMSAIVQDTAVMYNTYAETPTAPTALPNPTGLPNPTTLAAQPTLQSTSPTPPTTRPPSPAVPTTSTTPDSTLTQTPPPIQNALVSKEIPSSRPDSVSHPDTALTVAMPTITRNNPPAAVPVQSPVSVSSIQSAAPNAPTGVVKLSERKSSQFLSMIYTDQPPNKKPDTIDVLIPIDSASRTTRPVTRPNPPAAQSTRPNPTVTQTTQPSSTVTQTIQPLHNPDSPHSVSAKPAAAFVNSDCHAFATDYDVDKLRVRMLDAAKDDDRILAARKVFKIKCINTRQIRALSEVFTSDAAKFKFFEASYPFCSDDHFPELADLLSDPVYTSKFRTMTARH